MERDAIERRDFPVGRRGYEQGAVDAHLRRVADEMESLRERGATASRGLSAGASDQVREILEAAERSASGIREQAEQDASEHVARVGEATAAMMSRIDQLQRELDGLLEALRRSGERLQEGLARLQEDVGAAAPEEDYAGAAPAAVDPALPPAPPRPAPPRPAPAIDEPADAESFAPAAGASDEAGARLTALNMALGGTPRHETARFLAEHYELEDPEALLDDVYKGAGA
jgi:DivIVA domain-containing protein